MYKNCNYTNASVYWYYYQSSVKTGRESANSAIEWVATGLNCNNQKTVVVMLFGQNDEIAENFRKGFDALKSHNFRGCDGWCSSLEQLLNDVVALGDLLYFFVRSEQVSNPYYRHEVVQTLKRCGYEKIVEVYIKSSNMDDDASSDDSRPCEGVFEKYPPNAKGIDALIVVEYDTPSYMDEKRGDGDKKPCCGIVYFMRPSVFDGFFI